MPSSPAVLHPHSSHHSGKTLGGSSSINGAAWTRGLDAQYDAWSQLLEQSEQNLNWNWASMFQYMKKVQTLLAAYPITDIINSQRHGQAPMASSVQRAQIVSMHTTVSMALFKSPSLMTCMAALNSLPSSKPFNPSLALPNVRTSTVADLTASRTLQT
jgi:hypothetical protein